MDRLFVFLTSAYSSYSSCRQYRENLADAMAEVHRTDPAWAPDMYLQRTYFNHPGFVEPFVRGAKEALDELPAGSRLVFTTHSLPMADAEASDYVAQHRDVAATSPQPSGRPANGIWSTSHARARRTSHGSNPTSETTCASWRRPGSPGSPSCRSAS